MPCIDNTIGEVFPCMKKGRCQNCKFLQPIGMIQWINYARTLKLLREYVQKHLGLKDCICYDYLDSRILKYTVMLLSFNIRN